MRPEHAAHGRKIGPRQAFEHARMIPEFELDDIGLPRQRGDVREIVRDDNARAGCLDHVGVAAIARLPRAERTSVAQPGAGPR